MLNWQPQEKTVAPDALLGQPAKGEYKLGDEPHKFTRKFTHKWLLTGALGAMATLCQFWLFECVRSRDQVTSGDAHAQVQVLVATRPLKKGTKLRSEDLTSVNLPVHSALAGVATIKDLELLQDRRLRIDVPKEGVIVRDGVSTRFDQLSATERIPLGKRLFVLKAELGEISRLLSPGDRVDILAHLTLPDFGQATETLLEAVPLVGIGDGVEAQWGESAAAQSEAAAVSFYASADEVKLLAYAQQHARFSLVLRNPNDLAKAQGSPSMTLNRFLAHPRIQHALNGDLFQIHGQKPHLPKAGNQGPE